MKMEISQKDKKLLVYLLAIVIIACAYYFGARPLIDKNLENTDRIAALEVELANLNAIYNRREEFTGKIADEKLRVEEAMNKFPADLTQEGTLMMIQDIEDNTGAWITRVSFSEEKLDGGAGSTEISAEEEIALVEEELEEVHTGEPAELKIENLQNVQQSLSLDYFCSYSNFKKFLDYVQNYDQRLFIENLSATYSADANEVSGSIVLTQYAIRGTGKEVKEPDLSGISLGTDNIFTTLRGTNDIESAILEAGQISLEDAENQENSEDSETGESTSESSSEEGSSEEKPSDSQSAEEAPAQAESSGGANLGDVDPSNSGRRKRAN